MGAVNGKTLRANTLVEVLVASVIFLAVFMIGLETLSRLTVRDDEGLVFVEADWRVKECFFEFSDGLHPVGKYDKNYDWGEIQVTIAPYRDYRNLQELTLAATILQNRKRIEYKYIIEIDE